MESKNNDIRKKRNNNRKPKEIKGKLNSTFYLNSRVNWLFSNDLSRNLIKDSERLDQPTCFTNDQFKDLLKYLSYKLHFSSCFHSNKIFYLNPYYER